MAEIFTLIEGHHRLNSLTQFCSVDLDVTTMCGPFIPLKCLRYPNRDIVWSVFPKPISSASYTCYSIILYLYIDGKLMYCTTICTLVRWSLTMPLIPLSWSLNIQLRPCSWYSLISPSIKPGVDVMRVSVESSTGPSFSRASSSFSVMRPRLVGVEGALMDHEHWIIMELNRKSWRFMFYSLRLVCRCDFLIR